MSRAGFLALVVAASLGAEPLTLAKALRLAGGASLAADSARLSDAAAREDSAQIKALYLPEFSFSGGFRALDNRPELLSQPMHLGPITVPSQVFPVEDKNSWRYKASLQYLVWDFGKRESALSASLAKEEGVSLSGSAETRKAQSEVANRYLELLNIKAQKRVAAQRHEALAAHLKNAEALFEHGVVARNDVLRTEVALRSVEDLERSLDQAYQTQLEALNVAMGQPGITSQELPEDLQGPPSLPWDEAACRGKAEAGNERVRAAQARVKALGQQAAFRRKDYLPNVVAELSHTYAQNSFVSHERENAAFLGLSWKIFDGGIRGAKVRQADIDTDRARRDLLEAQRQAGNAAVGARRAFDQSLREVKTAQTNVSAAEENLRIVSDQYREGLVRNADVLDAEAILAESRSAFADKRFRAFGQQAALLAILGEDLPTFYESQMEK
jgi:outer membrane protein TolC